MIIHHPELIIKNEHIVLWAKVELAKHQHYFPEYIWFRVPIQYAEAFRLQADAFLIPALSAGMYFHENIEVRGSISPKLAYHLNEYQSLLNLRFPGLLHKIEVKYSDIKAPAGRVEGVGTTFSGGVDSMFTFWKHIPQNQADPDFQVTHAIFIKGFDLIHKEDDLYWQLFNKYQRRLTEIGVDLIPLETNIASLRHLHLPASYLFGPTICGAALALAGIYRLFYIPSSWDYHALKKKAYGSDPWLDRLVSTDSMRIMHHGADYRRVEKIKAIAEWEIAHDLLWVCFEYQFQGDRWNCSRCEKCVRTIIPLFALGKLVKFKTFSKPIQSNWESLWWIRKFSLRHDFLDEMYSFVKFHKKDLLPWLWIISFFGTVRYLLVTHTPTFIKKRMRKWGYFTAHNEEPSAYEIYEITRLIQSQNDHSST